MCFSASASFIVSGALATTSAVALTKTRGTKHELFTFIPLLFAVQQALEGLQWLTFEQTGQTALWLGWGFFFFAYPFWPIFFPLAAYRIETDERRRRIIRLFVGLGIISAALFLGSVLVGGLSINVMEHSIRYDITRPYNGLALLEAVASTLYLLVTIGSGLISSRPRIRLFGIAAAVSALVAWAFYAYAFASVWCFFAAALSIILLTEVWNAPRTTPRRQ